jgi:vacuolar-type H+-ATPase subunit E/Vma4
MSIDDNSAETASSSEPPRRAVTLSSPERLREVAERAQQKAKERDQKARQAARERAKQTLLSDKQLTLWVDAVRGAPNEIVRSALFTAKNHNKPRKDLKQSVVAVVGEGKITYTGEELRQDDETVWLQLIHLARENGLSTAFSFTPKSFCEAIRWTINGETYDRLDKCMTRLQATSLKISSQRLGDEVSLSMLPGYKANRRKDGDGGVWTVRMHDELVFLFSEFQYTRVEWQQRLALPVGLATWLHAYYASHREPFAVKVEKLAVGAGLMTEEEVTGQDSKSKERLRDVKKLIIKALEALREAGFLIDFEVTRSRLVHVRRASDTRPMF